MTRVLSSYLFIYPLNSSVPVATKLIVNHRKEPSLQPSLLTPLTPKLGEGGVRSAT